MGPISQRQLQNTLRNQARIQAAVLANLSHRSLRWETPNKLSTKKSEYERDQFHALRTTATIASRADILDGSNGIRSWRQSLHDGYDVACVLMSHSALLTAHVVRVIIPSRIAKILTFASATALQLFLSTLLNSQNIPTPGIQRWIRQYPLERVAQVMVWMLSAPRGVIRSPGGGSSRPL